MSSPTFNAELARWGPEAGAATPSLAEAQAYCRQLAQSHYENFTVASWLIDRRLRPHFYALYAYCRWSDDLADETADPAVSLRLLDWWQVELEACYRGRATHPVFVALAETIREFNLPQQPLADLLIAFRQDQRVQRYQTSAEVLAYCRNSANPVGRLVLRLGRSYTDETERLSDSICTGLQLANFCQDVARDWARGRLYLPLDSLGSFGYTLEMLDRGEESGAFRLLMAQEVDRAEEYLLAGLPLVKLVARPIRLEVALFIAGGLEILRVIRGIDYGVLSQRPTVSRSKKFKLLVHAWWRSHGV